MTDHAARRHEYLLFILGIALTVIAILLIFNGKPSNFAWDYPACVAWRAESCSHIPGAAHCSHAIIVCTQTHRRLFSWVFIWLVESGLITALAFAAVFRIRKRK